jgi:hypothetical protein
MAKAKVKLDLKSLTITQLIQKVRTVVTQSTGNSMVTGSPVAVAQLTTATDNLDAKAQAVEVNRQAGQTLTTEQGNVRGVLEGLFTQFGGYVEIKANGDAALIQSTGLDVRAAATPIGNLGQVLNLSITVGDSDGELDLDWDNVNGASGYLMQRSFDPVTTTSWVSLDPVTASKATVSNLTSGTKYWFRVAATGSAGPGPWSDPATKIAP